jgi:23S rRNA (uridine2552-2'-O)-methyltransferase
MVKRTASSARWLKEHVTDEFVIKAQKDDYRSRAVYKLEELDEKDHLLKAGELIIDLGASPGGWSQFAARKLDGKSRIIALDILPMDPLAGVEFIQGDFREESVLQQLLDAMGSQSAGLVMSDMSPEHSGIRTMDIPRAYYLAELALELARERLKKGGDFVVKVFQGEGFDHYMHEMKQSFQKVVSRKPKASRARSHELYLLGKGFLGR